MQLASSLVEACMWDLIPRPGIEPGPPALGARSLNHCATREVPQPVFLSYLTCLILEPDFRLHARQQCCLSPSLRICPFLLGCPFYWRIVACSISPSLDLSFLVCNVGRAFLVLAPKVLHPRTPSVLGKPGQSVTLQWGK